MLKSLKRAAVALTFLLAVAAGLIAWAYVTTPAPAALPATVDVDPALPRIALEGRLFHSETFGDPADPTVIVLHGGPGSDYRYLLGLQALADRYFVVFYDQRGGGLSTRIGAEGLTAQDMVDDLDLFADHYSPDRPVILIGHSWGAMLAAAYIGQHPERVSQVVLAEPGALTDEAMQAFQAHFASIMDADLLLRIAPVYIEALHIADGGERADFIAARQAELWSSDADNPYHCPGRPMIQPAWRVGATAGAAIQSSARTPAGLTDMSLFSANADRYPRPILFLASACNTWLGEDLQRQHASLFPVAEVVVIPAAGHMLFNDNPEASLAAVWAYLESAAEANGD
ncbi:MAG: alpha/beta fold hydrolase [Anaerolineales bacterium]|nr:alpha/beta fold hydrolase [Anaerolineales bacterium]